jgi:hypothetical protein
LLQGTGGVGGTFAGEILELVGLGADNLLKVGDLLVDDFTVADVHERSEVGNGHGDNSETPERNETDEPVASEGSSESLETYQNTAFGHIARQRVTYGNSVDDILSEQNALELDQEKVQQLGKVLQDSLMGLLGNGVVAARAERAGNALLEDELTGNLNGSGHCKNGSVRLLSDTHRSRDQLTAQRHVQELEGPAEKR